MSRTSTRNKNKRPHPEEDSNEISSRILRKIYLTGEIAKSDICQLFHLRKPVCYGCRVNSKDSPNCFCGFIPASNGVRKAGLWQKTQDIIASFGSNPLDDLRESTDTPAGLTNLGATCYANSILQCLYMNMSFRQGIYSLEPDLLKRLPVLDQLARLFAQLHSSKMAFIDSAPFIKMLELKNGEQQDGHEFLTLFLSLLENSLSHSKVPGARTIVQDSFRGCFSHVTRCSSCGKDSESSSKMEDFYGLELNIKNLDNLEESLDEYLSVEELHGDNQYFCESCNTRVDATRRIKLHSLPTVVNFQLKRYVFHPKTATKKKISSMFGFPSQLDMGRWLSNPSESGCMYELTAILLHKGTAVSSGHYVAHIKDENSSQWWLFDDENISKLGSHPFGENCSKSSNKAENDSKFSFMPTCSSDGNHVNGSHSSKFGCHSEIFSSTDAYMLMYKQVRKDKNIVSYNNEENSSVLPPHLLSHVEELNASYGATCKEYQMKKDEQLDRVAERRKEVKSILSEAPVCSDDEPYFWIATDWLRQWADSIDPPPCIDNTLIQCEHGKVIVSKANAMKRLSSTAWHMLLTKYGGGPPLGNDDFCSNCLKELAQCAVSANEYRDRKASVKQLAEAALAGKSSDGPCYFVSRSWLTQWLRKKSVDAVCNIDSGPTSSLRCPHGSLFPEQAPGTKRVQVAEVLWLFLRETIKSSEYDNLQTFPVDTKECEICCHELSVVASTEDSIREVKLIQRRNHEKLLSGKSLTLSSDQKYFLIPSSWLEKWKAYILTAAGKNASSAPEPDGLEAIMETLICAKHSRLLQRPMELVCKRDVITQKSPISDGLTVIPEADWNMFCEEWNVPKEKGISAKIVFSCCSKLDRPVSFEEKCSKNNLLHNGEYEDLDGRMPYIRTYPEICEECIGEKESYALVEKLNYLNEDIRVYFVRGKEAPKWIKEATTAALEPDRRVSKRARRTTYGNAVNFKVSCSTSVYQLKMMLWESFGVVKENQQLYKGSVEIKDDCATLADKNIFPGDVLWVRDTEIYENRDIADEIMDEKITLGVEEGFRGTLLSSCLPSQVFQDKPRDS